MQTLTYFDDNSRCKLRSVRSEDRLTWQKDVFSQVCWPPFVVRKPWRATSRLLALSTTATVTVSQGRVINSRQDGISNEMKKMLIKVGSKIDFFVVGWVLICWRSPTTYAGGRAAIFSWWRRSSTWILWLMKLDKSAGAFPSPELPHLLIIDNIVEIPEFLSASPKLPRVWVSPAELVEVVELGSTFPCWICACTVCDGTRGRCAFCGGESTSNLLLWLSTLLQRPSWSTHRWLPRLISLLWRLRWPTQRSAGSCAENIHSCNPASGHVSDFIFNDVAHNVLSVAHLRAVSSRWILWSRMAALCAALSLFCYSCYRACGHGSDRMCNAVAQDTLCAAHLGSSFSLNVLC